LPHLRDYLLMIDAMMDQDWIKRKPIWDCDPETEIQDRWCQSWIIARGPDTGRIGVWMGTSTWLM
jgi:hypothetical protein